MWGVEMESLIENMIEVLNAQYDNYRKLLELSREKSDVIVDGRLDQLEKMVRLEEQLIIEAGRLEQKRMNTACELAEGLGIPQQEITIDLLMEHGSQLHKKRLMELKSLLNRYIADQKRINELNSKLLNNYLDYIEFTLNLLTGADQEVLYHGKDKGQAAGVKRSLFDKKV